MNVRGLPMLALVLLAGGCGKDSGADAMARPTGADEVVVQVVVDGGFVPREVALATVPTTTVLGDGTVITPAPTLAIYPGPALAPLQSVKVDGATLDRLVSRADALGLLGPPLDFGRPPVADAPNTTVTIVARGQTYRHVAYALGITDESTSPANRRALTSFLEALQQLPPGTTPWQPAAVAVHVVGPYQPDRQLPQPAMPWPLARPPAAECFVVQGDDLAVLRAALTRANARTPWVIDGVSRSVAFVPVVPGMPGCPT
jgi:hypothetical protein